MYLCVLEYAGNGKEDGSYLVPYYSGFTAWGWNLHHGEPYENNMETHM